MKKIISLISICIVGIMLIGCQNGQNGSQIDELGYQRISYKNKYKTEFFRDISILELSEYTSLKEYKTDNICYDTLLENLDGLYRDIALKNKQEDLERLKKYKHSNFNDDKLKELALNYIDVVEREKALMENDEDEVDYIDYEGNKMSGSSREMLVLHIERYKILLELIEKYNLGFAENHNDLINSEKESLKSCIQRDREYIEIFDEGRNPYEENLYEESEYIY